MDYAQRDHNAIIAHCERELPQTPVRVTYLPPQKTPRWARSYTAVARGTALGNGHYIKQGVTHA
jgi:hypothetical protein